MASCLPTSPTFAELFKKYRLRSEIETLNDFAQEMQNRGLQYEESIYSHWQRGTRIPRDRNLLLIVIKIFIERGGITTAKEVNTLLESAEQGYLTEKEINKLPRELLPQAPFLAPREIRLFTGRKAFLEEAEKYILTGTSLLISGCAGVGKSSCAIKLAHKLAEHFPDGVLWYRLDTSTPESILNSIAYTYGENISQTQDINHKSSFIRSLLSKKRVLIVFDNLERSFPLDLLLPNSDSCVVLVTTRDEDLADKFSLKNLSLASFDQWETKLLQRSILGDDYVQKYHIELDELSLYLGHLPLAVNLIAHELCKPYQQPKKLLKRIIAKKLKLAELKYENQDLLSSLNLVYNALSEEDKKLFVTLGVFAGTDFALEAVAAINNLNKDRTEKQLRDLINSSLVEYSSNDRFRLHPVIKFFVEGKLKNQTIYKRAAEYYYLLMKKKRKKINYFKLLSIETISITCVFKKCIKLNYAVNVEALWTDLFYFLWDMGEWNYVESLAKLTYGFATKHNHHYLKALCCVEGLGWVYYWTGRTNLAVDYIRKALSIGIKTNNAFLIAYAKQRLGRTLQGIGKFKKSMTLLKESLQYFKKVKDYRIIGNNYRYLSETSSFMGNNTQAKKYLHEALNILNKFKNKFILTEMYKNLINAHIGALLLLEGKNDEAELYFTEGLNIDTKAGTKTVGLMWSNIGLGLVFEKRNDFIRANLHFQKAKKIMSTFNLGRNIKKRHVFINVLYDELGQSCYLPREFLTT